MPEYDQIADDVAQIRKDVDAILHGNGRKGLWALSDAVFGPPGHNHPGLVDQVKGLAEARARDANMREGSRRTLIALGAVAALLSGGGVAIGVRVLQTLAELSTLHP